MQALRRQSFLLVNARPQDPEQSELRESFQKYYWWIWEWILTGSKRWNNLHMVTQPVNKWSQLLGSKLVALPWVSCLVAHGNKRMSENHTVPVSLSQHTHFTGAAGRSSRLPSLGWAWASRQHPSRSVFKAGLSWTWWRRRAWACQMSWPPPMPPALLAPNHSQPLIADVSTTAKSIFNKNMIDYVKQEL